MGTKALVFSAMFLGTFLATAQADAIESKNGRSEVRFFDDRNWKIILKNADPYGQVIQYAPEQAPENGGELITTEFFQSSPTDAASLEKGVVQTKTALLNRCPSLKFKETDRSARSISYEWEVSGCEGEPDQTEMARVAAGKNGLHVIHYAVRKTGLPKTEKDKWRGLLMKMTPGGGFAEALVDKGGKKV